MCNGCGEIVCGCEPCPVCEERHEYDMKYKRQWDKDYWEDGE